MPSTPSWNLESLPSVAMIMTRLNELLPDGVEGRGNVVGERAARTVFVFLYIQAVDRLTTNRLRPNMVTLMTAAQAQIHEPAARESWRQRTLQPGVGRMSVEGRWYAENTREPIRDETIRGFLEIGAVIEDASLATTSPTPRYQLAYDFAMLFDPKISGEDLDGAMDVWRQHHLGAAVQARIALVRQQAAQQGGATVHFSNGAVRVLAAGPSMPLVKAAVEEFVPRFLHQGVVLAVTESRQRLAYEDQNMLALVKLAPDPRMMPDIMLADAGTTSAEIPLVFLEMVATGGANTTARVVQVREWLRRHGLTRALAAFGTVFPDRGHATFSRYFRDLAWGSFAWLASEPDNLIALLAGGDHAPRASLASLMTPV